MRETRNRTLVLCISSWASLEHWPAAETTAEQTPPARVDLDEKELIDRFHILYYSHKPYINSYLGIISA